MNELLLSGRWVVLSPHDIRTDHALLVRCGRVAEAGPTAQMRARHPGLPEFGGVDCAVLPGLINAHHHCYGVELANQCIKDDFLEPWMFNGPAMVDLPPQLATGHAALRLLQSGVTTVVDMCAAGPDRARAETRLRDKAQAYRRVGLRAVIAPGERWSNRIIHGAGEEAAFLATLPPPLHARLRKAEATRQRLTPADYLDLLGDLIGENDGQTDFWFGPTGPQWMSEDLLADIARHAERLDARVQTHALESHYESIESPRIHGHSAIEHFARHGLLNGRLSLAHAVWATDADLDQIARAGTQISHNPGSNLRLRSGIAPATRMRAAGVTTALGMDGTTLAGDEDMFAEMRLALHLNRPPHSSAPSLTARDVLEMATVSGARLLGRADELGQLHPGFLADAVVLNLTRLLRPWTDPSTDPAELIIARAKACDVRDVLVGGRSAFLDGTPVGISEDALMDDLRAALDAQPPNPDARDLQADLHPWLMDWYARWDQDHANTHPPVQRYGARPLPTGKETS